MKKGYQAWVQSARVADAIAEVEVLKAEAAALLDKHLSKTAEQVDRISEFYQKYSISSCSFCFVSRNSLLIVL